MNDSFTFGHNKSNKMKVIFTFDEVLKYVKSYHFSMQIFPHKKSTLN